MKLSEMPLDKARACMVELTEALGVLAQDEDVAAYLSGERKGNDIVNLLALVNKLMRDHYGSLVIVLSVLSGVSKQDLRKMTMAEVVELAKGVFDEDLKRFFIS